MTAFTFDVNAFRISFPAFADVGAFPTATLQSFWDSGAYIIENNDAALLVPGPARLRCLNLITAHLAALSVIIADGQVPGLVQSATIDKITVSLTPPPLPTQFQWWLNQTAYGQQLLAILQVGSVGGIYAGGSPELSAFRKVGGFF